VCVQTVRLEHPVDSESCVVRRLEMIACEKLRRCLPLCRGADLFAVCSVPCMLLGVDRFFYSCAVRHRCYYVLSQRLCRRIGTGCLPRGLRRCGWHHQCHQHQRHGPHVLVNVLGNLGCASMCHGRSGTPLLHTTQFKTKLRESHLARFELSLWLKMRVGMKYCQRAWGRLLRHSAARLV